jgi:hypothetical protein
MSKVTTRRLMYRGLTGLVLLAISSACFVNCASGEHAANAVASPAVSPAASCPTSGHPAPPRVHPDTNPPNYITCTGTVDCENSVWFPECGNFDNITCVAPAVGQPKQCLFRLLDQGGCFCLERDIRNCTMGTGGTGGAGIQRCVKLATETTNWGGCGGI